MYIVQPILRLYSVVTTNCMYDALLFHVTVLFTVKYICSFTAIFIYRLSIDHGINNVGIYLDQFNVPEASLGWKPLKNTSILYIQ